MKRRPTFISVDSFIVTYDSRKAEWQAEVMADGETYTMPASNLYQSFDEKHVGFLTNTKYQVTWMPAGGEQPPL